MYFHGLCSIFVDSESDETKELSVLCGLTSTSNFITSRVAARASTYQATLTVDKNI
jgi:hypothetical protein